MPRPPVDVVVPFRGSPGARRTLADRLGRLHLEPRDTLVIVENTPGAAGGTGDPVHILRATGIASPGYARNRGAEAGRAPWIVFIDADTEPVPDLLERYFDPPPTDETVLLAGGVVDEPVGPRAPIAARYAHLRRTLHQDRTLGMGPFAFAQAANIACRRSAFTAAGGFREDIRAGEDADLSLRLRALGGRIERREAASVVHRSRRTVRELAAQAALHGAGSAWVNHRYPGSFPSRRLPGLLWWGLRTVVGGSARFARTGDRDVLVRAVLEPLWEIAFEIGRFRPAAARAGRGAEPAGTLRRR